MWLKRQRQKQRGLVYLRDAVVMSFLDQSDGCAAYVEWERGAPPKRPSGSAPIAVISSAFRRSMNLKRMESCEVINPN